MTKVVTKLLVVVMYVLVLALGCGGSALAHELTAPEVVVAAPDGTFSFSAVFTYGPGGGYFAADFIDCSVNVDAWMCYQTGDGFCRYRVEEGHTETYAIDGQLQDSSLPGRVTVSHSTDCPGDPDPGDHTVTTIVLPPSFWDSPAVLNLRDHRFAVMVEWLAWQGPLWQGGWAGVAPHQTDDSGLFWFFSPDNWELMAKVLDGCQVNDHFWVFSAAATNVEYTLSVVDTTAGSIRLYSNPWNHIPLATTDTTAFATCP